jgi:hypothetical protein
VVDVSVAGTDFLSLTVFDWYVPYIAFFAKISGGNTLWIPASGFLKSILVEVVISCVFSWARSEEF